MSGERRPFRDERGAALFLAIVLAGALAAVAAVVTLTARTETLLAGRFQQGREAAYIAESGAERATADLSLAGDWSGPLSGTPSTFAIGDAGPARALDAAVRRTANGGRSWGADTPQWRLYAWGPASAWVPGGDGRTPFFVAVWIADDPEDGDGNPAADANGVVELYSVALAPGGARRMTRTLVARPLDPDGERLLEGVLVLTQYESRW